MILVDSKYLLNSNHFFFVIFLLIPVTLLDPSVIDSSLNVFK